MAAVTVVDGRTQRGQRNREAIIDALLACYEDGDPPAECDEVGPRRRVGPIGAQPLRRRRGACGRGRAAAMGAVRAARQADRLVLPARRSRSSVASGPRSSKRHAGPARGTALGRTTRRRSRATSPGSIGAPPAARARVPRLDAEARRARRDHVVGRVEPMRTAQGCSVSRARRILIATIRTLVEGSSSMSAIRPNKAQFLELMNAPDEGPVVMLNLLKFKPTPTARATARRVRQVRRRRRADGRGARRQGAVDGSRRPDPHRRPDRRLGLRRARAVPEPQGVHRDGDDARVRAGARAPRVGLGAHGADRVHRARDRLAGI